METTNKKKPDDLDNPKYDYVPTDVDIQKEILQHEKLNKKKK